MNIPMKIPSNIYSLCPKSKTYMLAADGSDAKLKMLKAILVSTEALDKHEAARASMLQRTNIICVVKGIREKRFGVQFLPSLM